MMELSAITFPNERTVGVRIVTFGCLIDPEESLYAPPQARAEKNAEYEAPRSEIMSVLIFSVR
jgi:hypothetical protein